jgi:hypothetical protein
VAEVESPRSSLITISESPITVRAWMLLECAIWRPMYTARVSSLLLVFFPKPQEKSTIFCPSESKMTPPTPVAPGLPTAAPSKNKVKWLLSFPLRKVIVTETEFPVLSFDFSLQGKREGCGRGSHNVFDPIFFTLFQSAFHVISDFFGREDFRD